MRSVNRILTIGILIIFCACQSQKEDHIIIATSANVQFAMEKMVAVFTKQTGIACDLVVSSSGKLTAQIMEGAPYDVFVSADTHYPEVLYQNGWAIESPKIYARGKLVLWTIIPTIEPSLHLLTSPIVKHIALANPQTAPYGIAAIEAMNHIQLKVKIEDKLVYGESISQTNQFIISKSAEMGFTAKSVVLSDQMKDLGRWIEIPDSLYTAIHQSAVLIKKEGESTEHARKFYDFLFSKDAREIFENYGYELGEKR